jgi:hypothetical protein
MTAEGEQVTVTGKVKFFNEAKGWLVEAVVKWAAGWTLSHFQ